MSLVSRENPGVRETNSFLPNLEERLELKLGQLDNFALLFKFFVFLKYKWS